MNILFLVKFYQPFDRGGSEWSTHDLAKLLVKKGHYLTILTPNYGGAVSNEVIEGIKIQRLPFIKLDNPKGPIAPYWTNNIIWFIYSTIYAIYVSLKVHVDIIHAHSNEFIPAAAVASTILNKPSIVTFRDYQALCNLGFCLWGKNRVCDLKEFLTSDFPFFYQNYIQNKNLLKYSLLLIAAIRARLMQKTIYFFAKKIDYQIGVSQKVVQVFRANSIEKIIKIYNPVIIDTKIPEKSYSEILYIGKFSKGKGVDILFSQILDILKVIPQARFKFIGSGYLQKELKNKTRKRKLGEKVTFTDQINHDQALSMIKKAGIVVVPSIWPEPLPRSALESILSGIPVVATDVGGLREVVINNIYGILCKPDARSIKDAVITAFRHKEKFRGKIAKDIDKLQKHFGENVVSMYQKVYQSAVSK